MAPLGYGLAWKILTDLVHLNPEAGPGPGPAVTPPAVYSTPLNLINPGLPPAIGLVPTGLTPMNPAVPSTYMENTPYTGTPWVTDASQLPAGTVQIGSAYYLPSGSEGVWAPTLDTRLWSATPYSGPIQLAPGGPSDINPDTGLPFISMEAYRAYNAGD